MKTPTTLIDQLRGATRTAADATRNVTDLVEAMHHAIGGGPDLLGRPLESVTKAWTAPAYGATRAVTALVAASLDATLAALRPVLNGAGVERGAVLSALNGVIGDYLAETGNALAIEMRLCGADGPLDLTAEAVASAFPDKGRRLLVLLHGSSVDERAWLRNNHDHGAALARDAEFVPLYVRYNSGRHVSTNGRDVAALLEQLVDAWPEPVEELALLGHSMGGLVARSACAAGEAAGHAWRSKLRALVTLGTPHHGAPLERAGNWIDVLLGISRYSAPLGRLGKLRSAGVTDLRYGNVVDADWHGRDRFEGRGDGRTSVPLPADIDCFAIAATTAAAMRTRLPGDGLVPVDSALARHADPGRCLHFDEQRQWIAFGTTHLGLLDSAEVYAKLVAWLAPRPAPR